ncbi:coiled-coil domain-containing protein 80-like [Lingula anatina]|uniref:Coiled-coil domain-containing protein 80-like n=1 Tax=Lingula anatina TaxID=7574 RepID=A0A1S3HCG6_LINAN|nr:coiled-coil domain-containing protein 80-like [Lingula anatina]|eukprot:XP_013383722.1 coiled-coil domain-containing protein 80-like [Lingula anatina]
MATFTALTTSLVVLTTVVLAGLTGGAEKPHHEEVILPFSWLQQSAEDAKSFLVHREKRGFWEFFRGDDDDDDTTTTTTTPLPTTTSTTTTTTTTTTTPTTTTRPTTTSTTSTTTRTTTTSTRQTPRRRPPTPYYYDTTTTTTARPWWKVFVGKEETTVTTTPATTTTRPPPPRRTYPTRRPYYRQTRPPQRQGTPDPRVDGRHHRYRPGRRGQINQENYIPVFNPVIQVSNRPSGSNGKTDTDSGLKQGSAATRPGSDTSNVQRAPPGVPVAYLARTQYYITPTLAPPIRHRTPSWHRPEVRKRILLERQRERHSPDYRRHLRAWLRKWRLSGGEHYRNRLRAAQS